MTRIERGEFREVSVAVHESGFTAIIEQEEAWYPYSDTWVHCQNFPLQNGGFTGASAQGHECLKCPQLVVLQSMFM